MNLNAVVRGVGVALAAACAADSPWPRAPRPEQALAYDAYNCGGIAFGLDRVMDAADIETELGKPAYRASACAADCAPGELKFWYWDAETRPAIRFDYDDDADGRRDRSLGPDVVPAYYHAAAKCQGANLSWVKDGFDAPFVSDPSRTGPETGRVRRVRSTGKGTRTDVFTHAGAPPSCWCKAAGPECAP